MMAGCCLHDYEGARRKWEQFWTTYKEIHPGFSLFDDDSVDLSRCAAFFIHGDEGRTLKKGGMLVTSLQSALGRGYDEKRVRRPGEGGRDDLQVNFAGHSFTTRFILSAIPPRGSKSSIWSQKCVFDINTGMQITLFEQNLGF